VALVGGELTVRSDTGGGTEVHAVLPLERGDDRQGTAA
jgi:hypothetical protein